MKKTGRRFVTQVLPHQMYEQRRQQVDATNVHLKEIAEKALGVGAILYHEHEVKPDAGTMFAFLVATMVSLQLDTPLENIMANILLYREQFGAMGTILLLQWECMGLRVPEQFPFTLEQFKRIAEGK